MKTENLNVPRPFGICEPCLKDKRNTFIHAATKKVIVSYCSHNRTGGVLHLAESPQWTLYTPIDRETFFDEVNAAAVEATTQPCAKIH